MSQIDRSLVLSKFYVYSTFVCGKPLNIFRETFAAISSHVCGDKTDILSQNMITR